MIHISGEPTI